MTTDQPASSAPITNDGAVTQNSSNVDAAKAADTEGKNLLDNNGAPKADDAAKVADDANKADQGKTDDQAKNGEGKKPDDGKKPEQKAPDKYEDFKMLEGTEVDAELMGEFTTLAKELNLTQEQAQKLAELGGKIALKANGPSEQVIVDEAKATWGAQAQADKEIGGDKFVENLATAKKALDSFGSTEFKDILGKSGFCNHPEMIRFLYNIGKQVGDDKVLVDGGRPSSSEQTAANKLYGATSVKT